MRKIDLNDFWRGDVELANLAAQLMTEREDRDDAVWAGDPYGSTILASLRQPGAEELVRREIERASEVTGVAVEIESVERQTATLQAMETRLVLTPSGLAAEEG